jgi:hypothetical protein
VPLAVEATVALVSPTSLRSQQGAGAALAALVVKSLPTRLVEPAPRVAAIIATAAPQARASRRCGWTAKRTSRPRWLRVTSPAS